MSIICLSASHHGSIPFHSSSGGRVSAISTFNGHVNNAAYLTYLETAATISASAGASRASAFTIDLHGWERFTQPVGTFTPSWHRFYPHASSKCAAPCPGAYGHVCSGEWPLAVDEFGCCPGIRRPPDPQVQLDLASLLFVAWRIGPRGFDQLRGAYLGRKAGAPEVRAEIIREGRVTESNQHGRRPSLLRSAPRRAEPTLQRGTCLGPEGKRLLLNETSAL